MGEERKGLPADLQAHCDLMVQIPMVGKSDSLNLANAASLSDLLARNCTGQIVLLKSIIWPTAYLPA
jgi:tRNA G18 (ribose-2'-O)-methylase SpoU